MPSRWSLLAALIGMGLCWGLTIPLIKIAVSTGHQPFGLIFWQLVIVTVLLLGVTWARRKPVVLARRHWRLFVMIALCGALLPDVFFYTSAVHLPAGFLALILASVPLFSLMIALILRVKSFDALKVIGVLLGMGGIVLLSVADTPVPLQVSALFVLIALLAPFFYALEGNLVALWGTGELDSVQTLVGASLIACVISLPLALGSGQWINPTTAFGIAEMALVASAAIHALTYAGYVWLVQRAGSVFAAQLSYIVNASGIAWAIILLGESYSWSVWAAVAVMTAGLLLVRPVSVPRPDGAATSP